MDINSTDNSLTNAVIESPMSAYLLPKEHPLHIPPHVAVARIDIEVHEIRRELELLKLRNIIRDRGKKFESSWTRTFVIMLLTYFTLSIYMMLIEVQRPYLNAVVPTLGFNLSTWSLPHVKKIWEKFYEWNYENPRGIKDEDDDLVKLQEAGISTV